MAIFKGATSCWGTTSDSRSLCQCKQGRQTSWSLWLRLWLSLVRREEALGKCISKVIRRKWNRFVQLPFPLWGTTTTKMRTNGSHVCDARRAERRRIRIRTRFWFWFVCETHSHSALHIACMSVHSLGISKFSSPAKVAHKHTDTAYSWLRGEVGRGSSLSPAHPVFCWCSHKAQKSHALCINKQISEIKNIRNDLKTQLNAHCCISVWVCVCAPKSALHFCHIYFCMPVWCSFRLSTRLCGSIALMLVEIRIYKIYSNIFGMQDCEKNTLNFTPVL